MVEKVNRDVQTRQWWEWMTDNYEQQYGRLSQHEAELRIPDLGERVLQAFTNVWNQAKPISGLDTDSFW